MLYSTHALQRNPAQNPAFGRTVGDLVEVGGEVHAIDEACERRAATQHCASY